MPEPKCVFHFDSALVVVPSPRDFEDAPLVAWCQQCGALGFSDGRGGFAWRSPIATATPGTERRWHRVRIPEGKVGIE